MAGQGRGDGGDQRRMVNPKLLLLIGAVVLVVSSAIAVFYAATYTPDSHSGRATVTSLSSPAPAAP